MKIESLAIPDVKLIVPTRFSDARGHFMETWNERTFRAAGIAGPFVQDNAALSTAPGTVRGLHFQLPPAAQGKLVRVMRGSVLDVAVDLRKSSPTFGHHVAARLTAAGGEQLWVPVGFAHGYCTLEADTEMAYKVTDFYSPKSDRGIAWNDPALAIRWPVEPAAVLMSDKDRVLPLLSAITSPF